MARKQKRKNFPLFVILRIVELAEDEGGKVIEAGLVQHGRGQHGLVGGGGGGGGGCLRWMLHCGAKNI